MREEMDGRIWNEHHQEISEGLGKLFDGLAASVKRLHAWQWNAPWRHEAVRSDRPGHA